jgi:hypothetical protein
MGNVSGLSMTLGRNFTYRGKRRSDLSADCPVSKSWGASSPFARAAFCFWQGDAHLYLDAELWGAGA